MPRGLLLALVLSGAVASAAAGEPRAGDAAMLQFAQATDSASRAVRTIAPDLVAPPQIGDGELSRTDPRAPLSEMAPPAPAAPAAQKKRERDNPNMIFGPVASAAGRIEAEGMVIAIAGIELLEPEQTCRGRSGEWPCGMAARTAFRSFLRGRALDCDLPDGEVPARLATSCRLGSQDVGAWLVANGWAKVSSTGPYAQEQNQALAARRGIFGPGPETLPGTADTSEPVSEGERPPIVSQPSAQSIEPGPVAGEAPPVRTGVEPVVREPKGLY